MMWKAAVLAVCLLLAGAYDGPSYGVKLCGREFIRAVIFTCGGSRWRRSIMSTDDISKDPFESDVRDAAEGLMLPSYPKFSLQHDSEPVPFDLVREWQEVSVFSRPARFIISDEVLEALRTSSRKGRDVVVGLSNACCRWGCSKTSVGAAVKCWWRRVSSVSANVSIECQADPQGATLKCDLCHQHAVSFKPTAQFLQTRCSHMTASFSALMDAQKMQNADCTLHCPGHTTVPCMVQKGYPPPTCLVPFYEDEENIHCNWTGSHDPSIPTNFTLHWRDVAENGYNGDIDVGNSDGGIIPRDKYPAHQYIKVWVSATNTLEKLDSETLIIHTQSIIQPAPPSIISHNSEPLEFFWDVPDDTEHLGQWQCKVQYRKQCDQEWTEVEDTYEVSFILEDAVPFTTYKFRVRCRHDSDMRAVMSDWSSEYLAETPVAAPVGVLDVWSDCDSLSSESSCTVLWKEMPKQQARGNIDSYVVTMKLSNGSVLNINGSVYTTAEACTQCEQVTIRKEPPNLLSQAQQSFLMCPQEQEQSCFHYCHLRVPVKEVKCIGVTASTAGGRSTPAFVALPSTGPEHPAVMLEVRGGSQELNVSWSSLSDPNQEYVVQYSPVGPPHNQCLNWVKVQKNLTFVTLRGQLSDYTAYNVSLFAVVNNRSCLLKSAIAYTVEGVPPEVTNFQAVPTSPNSVNLTWTPVSANMSRGHVTQYVVGVKNSGVGIITSTIVIIVVPFLIIVLAAAIVCKLKKPKCMNVPDPSNSSSFKQLNNQSWQSWPVLSASMENGPTISHVIVVPEPEINYEFKVRESNKHQENDHSGNKELQRNISNNSMPCHQKEYSQMIDDSDEEGRQYEDEEWNEEPFSSDYEKHFLPCTVDI
ncbi:Relaxin-3 [Bagarius yarrelli]|uniref:Relaxin-3 n=1 Tax=Bagarius yarrelli TaxID=175774 RepID=A0A556UEN0_BAGYA|nr:Relaxin-3 [Bagarius yarrelli]